MKTALDHLPEPKQAELKRIVGMIRAAVDVEMVILFGSYARGDWVEEQTPDGLHWQYQSDFDLLVVVDERKLARKQRVWDRMREELLRRPRVGTTTSTPVSIITENIGGLNEHLSRGRFFYVDIQREGVLLYDSGRHPLAEAKERSAEERRKQAQDHFEQWFDSAASFYITFQSVLERGDYKQAAFQLHQSTENFYATILLVFIGYKPKTHDLEELSKKAAGQEPLFVRVFPQGTEEERRRFSLLREAYVRARYDKDYAITREELKWLGGRVEQLREWTAEACKKRIESIMDN